MENRPGIHIVEEEERNFPSETRGGLRRKKRQFERKWRELDPVKKVGLVIGAGILGASTCFGLTAITREVVTTDQAEVDGDEEAEPEIKPWTPPAPTPTLPPTATPQPEPELQKDKCGVINNSEREGFNPNLPERDNAFRVILHDTGDPKKVEKGPFEHTDRNGNTHTHQSVWEMEPPHINNRGEVEGEYVHNGDEICIKREGVSMPESFLPDSKRVTLRESMVDHNAKTARRLSKSINKRLYK